MNLFLNFGKIKGWRKKNYCHEKDYLDAEDGAEYRTPTFFKPP